MTIVQRLLLSWRGLAISGPLRRVYFVTVVDAIGLGIYLSLSALYLTEVIKLSNPQTGLVLSVSGAAALLGILPMGAVSDWMGAGRTLALLFAYRAATFLGILLAGNLITALLAVAAAGLASRATGPVTQALLLGLADQDADRVSSLAFVRALRNAGFVVGTLPSAIAITIGTATAYRTVLVLTVLCFAIAALLALRLPATSVCKKPTAARMPAYRDRRFVALTVLNGMLTLHAFVLSIGIPLWLIQETHAPRGLVSVFLVINAALAIGLQVRMSRGSESPVVARSMMCRAGLLLAVVCILIPVSVIVPGWLASVVLIGLVILLTLGEILQTAGAAGLSVAYTPADQRGAYMAFFNFGFAVATVVGPGAITLALEWQWFGWAALGCWFILVGCASLLLPVELGIDHEARMA